MDLKKLLVRSVSGLVYIALIIGCIVWGLTPLSCLAAVLGALATVEFEKITKELTPTKLPFTILDIAGVMCLSFGWTFYMGLVWLFIMICRMVLQLYVRSESPIADLAKSFAVQIYIGLPLCLMTLAGSLWSAYTVMAIFLFIWISDTGAFVVGSMFGRHRLFERVSPKKSWEGFFGGLVFNIIAAWCLSMWCGPFFHFRQSALAWIGLSVVVTVFATWGDLVESLMKRSLHIKDSGHIMPGHGGILDRIDSLLLVMPAAFLYLVAVFVYSVNSIS